MSNLSTALSCGVTTDQVTSIWHKVVKEVGAGVGWRLCMTVVIRVDPPSPGYLMPTVVFGSKPGYMSVTSYFYGKHAEARRIADLITKHIGVAVEARYEATESEVPTPVINTIVEIVKTVVLPATEPKAEPEPELEPKSKYQRYLESDAWKLRRNAMLWFADNRCQVCNVPRSEETLDVHHRTYERLYRERPRDLFVLCRKCHGLFSKNGRLAKP